METRINNINKNHWLEWYSPQQIEALKNCVECPRKCGIDRFTEYGYCKSPSLPKLSSANIHHGEEPPISGTRGSGTIFFAGCNMSCVYCQNYPISQLCHGSEISLQDLVEKMLMLQNKGAHNINIVTPSHATIAIEVALKKAKEIGLKIPIVYNSSGYDSITQLQKLRGLIEIYMPDIRYQDKQTAKKFSDAEDYPEINRKALKEMYNQVGNLQINSEGIATKGLLIRHLVLPNNKANTKNAIEFIEKEISPKTYLSLMAQYFPAYKANRTTSINRKITREEWNQARNMFEDSGLNGWVQDG